uniref:Retrotransposon Copia-like N-terminal domain-containing protein n=1 Tax=Fagus sylvatica TaxID=28930 RepID=A0A2N9EVS1_FAGSY
MTTTPPSVNTQANTQTPIFLLSNISNYVTVKLDHANYLMWKFQIIGILDAYSLLDHLQDPTPCPCNIVNLKRELNSIKKNSDIVTDYLQKIKEARNKLVSVGVHIDDEEILHIVLQGLPSEFHSFTSAMLTKNEVVRFEELHTLMKTEEDLLKSAMDNSKEIAHMAMVANKNSLPNFNNPSNAQFNGKFQQWREDILRPNSLPWLSPQPHILTKPPRFLTQGLRITSHLNLNNIPDNQAYTDSQHVSVGNGNQLPISHIDPRSSYKEATLQGFQ